MNGDHFHAPRGDDTAAHGIPAQEAGASVRERFQAREIAQVLSHYDLGVISEIREYRRGSRRAAKLKVSTERGDFLLKRRALGVSLERSRERASACHAVQARAAAAGVPVARLERLRSGGTLLEFGERLYELFEWVDGSRYGRHPEQARSAGDALARMHRAFEGFELLEELPEGGFSELADVRHALARAHERARERTAAGARVQLDASVAALSAHLDRVEAKLTTKGLFLQHSSICHGDFHPGNTLWSGDILFAVIDFDSARRESVAAELSNAMLQFAVKHRVGEDPLAWPVGLDAENLRAFADGYAAHSIVPPGEIAPFVPWLMISAIVAEAAAPIARDGDFAGIPAEPFLRATTALVDWISHRTRAISAVLAP